MNKLKLTFLGDSVLREVAKPVVKIDDNLRQVLNEMELIMNNERGAGLAGPQVGILQRILVFVDIDKYGEKGQVYKVINPSIISKSNKTVSLEEGCLSIQGPDGPVFSNVERPESVVVEWTDENGNHQEKEFSGFSGRAVQHEIDHLDGVLFIDYLSSIKREMVIRKAKKRK